MQGMGQGARGAVEGRGSAPGQGGGRGRGGQGAASNIHSGHFGIPTAHGKCYVLTPCTRAILLSADVVASFFLHEKTEGV